jgi:hypothetical protein
MDIKFEQLDILEKMDEVRRIADPIEYTEKTNFATGFKIDKDIGLNLNEATEMMGIKKARSDFGVTGDI